MNRSLSTSIRKRRMNFDTVRPFARWASQACSLTSLPRSAESRSVFLIFRPTKSRRRHGRRRRDDWSPSRGEPGGRRRGRRRL